MAPRVAVIDSGWNRARHEMRALPGVSYVGLEHGDAAPTLDDHDRIGHGTCVGDIILAMAPRVSLVPIRIFDTTLTASAGQLIAAIRWAVNDGAHLINLSLGTRRHDALKPLYRACEWARQSGCVIVAAGDTMGRWNAPAVFDHVIGVDSGAFASPLFYDYRPDEALECVAFAPAHVGSTNSGLRPTSYATATVTGLLGRLWSEGPICGLDEARHALARGAIRR